MIILLMLYNKIYLAANTIERVECTFFCMRFNPNNINSAPLNSDSLIRTTVKFSYVYCDMLSFKMSLT